MATIVLSGNTLGEIIETLRRSLIGKSLKLTYEETNPKNGNITRKKWEDIEILQIGGYVDSSGGNSLAVFFELRHPEVGPSRFTIWGRMVPSQVQAEKDQYPDTVFDIDGHSVIIQAVTEGRKQIKWVIEVMTEGS